MMIDRLIEILEVSGLSFFFFFFFLLFRFISCKALVREDLKRRVLV